MRARPSVFFGALLAAAICASLTFEARAQLKPEAQLGSRIPVKPTLVDAEQGGRIKKGFARCVYRKESAKIVAFLNAGDPLTIDYSRVGLKPEKLDKEFGMETCLSEQVDITQNALSFEFDKFLLRSMFQEESYLARYEVAPSLPAGSSENLEREYFSPAEKLPSARAMGQFADCIVFNDAPAADALLRTMPDSEGERIAARALAPTLGRCLIQGQSLALRPANIRAFAADGLWNRFVRTLQPTPVPAGGAR